MINTAYRSRKADYSLFAQDYTMVAEHQLVPVKSRQDGPLPQFRNRTGYGTSAVFIPCRDHASSSAFPQSFNGISCVTISFTCILPFSK